MFTITAINTCKKIVEFGQREVISFFTLVTNIESTLLFTQRIQTLTGIEANKRVKHCDRCMIVKSLASRIVCIN